MAINKVVYGAETLLDLTDDTVTADNLQSGITAHSKSGEQITGTLVVKVVQVSSTEPSSDDGSNGDIWLVID